MKEEYQLIIDKLKKTVIKVDEDLGLPLNGIVMEILDDSNELVITEIYPKIRGVEVAYYYPMVDEIEYDCVLQFSELEDLLIDEIFGHLNDYLLKQCST